MDGAGEQGDAVPADLVAKVLAGDADRPRAGWFEDVPLQVIPLFWVGQVSGNGHSGKASTPVLVAEKGGGQVAAKKSLPRDRAYPVSGGTGTR